MSELFRDHFDWEPKGDPPYEYRDFQPVDPQVRDNSEAALHQVKREIHNALGELDNLRVELLRLETSRDPSDHYDMRKAILSAQQAERYTRNAARAIRHLTEGS